MRFCIVSTQQHWGGGEKLLAGFSEQLERTGHSVAWITRQESDVSQRIRETGSPILGEIRRRGMSDILAIKAILRDWSPDVLIMNDTHAVVLAGVAAKLGLRHTPLRLAFKHTVFPLRSKLKYLLLADKIICVSEAARRTVVAGGLPPENTAVVYGGLACPTPKNNDTHRNPGDLRSELNLSPGRPIVVSIGSLLRCKGHDHLLEAVAGLPPADRPYVLIAGEGEERPNLENQIESLQLEQDVRLLGYREDTEALMRAANLVVHPSLAEGLSLVLIQAQMLERPILATAVGGAAEVLGQEACHQGSSEPNEKHGIWIAKPADVTDLRTQLGRALVSLRSPTQTLRDGLASTALRTKQTFSIETNAALLARFAAEEIRRAGGLKGPQKAA